jgi:hypothetical protein
VVKIDESVASPEAVAQFVSRDNLARIFKEHRQDLERLLWEFETKTVLAKLAGLQVHFENPEMQNPRNRRSATHESLRRPRGSIALQRLKVKIGEEGEHPPYFQ